MSENNHTIILIDGQCVLCNRLSHFVIPRDPSGRIRFAALQSKIGKRILSEAGVIDADEMKSVVFIRNGRLFWKSSAVLQIVRQLNGGWRLLYGFIFIPKPLRDLAYDWFAARRYRWFGKLDSCPLPSAVNRDRFLLDDDNDMELEMEKREQ